MNTIRPVLVVPLDLLQNMLCVALYSKENWDYTCTRAVVGLVEDR